MAEPKDTSWCWRYILRHRDMARKFSFHMIGNGRNTRFWEDNWHPMGVLADQFVDDLRYDSNLRRGSKVSNFITHHGWNFPPHLIPHVRDIYNDLHLVTVHPTHEDKIVWKPSVHGEFTVRSTYHVIRVAKPKPPWTRLIWFKGRIPKHSFISWFAIRKALLTRAKLVVWNRSTTASCILCGTGHETESHLFGGCSFSRLIWMHILHLLGYSRTLVEWQEEIEWCLEHFVGDFATVQRLLLCAYIYNVWCERNRRIHGEGTITWDQVLRVILKDVRIKVQALNISIDDNARNQQLVSRLRLDIGLVNKPVVHCSWFRPEVGWALVNTDGSLQQNSAGYGAIIRDHEGTVLGAAAGSDVPGSITKHELQAIEMGLMLAQQKNAQRVLIATDSKAVVQLILGSTAPPWHLITHIRRIEHLRAWFEEFQIRHIFRETNRAADLLSKLLPSSRFVEILPSSFADDLKKIIFEDKIGRIYDRL